MKAESTKWSDGMVSDLDAFWKALKSVKASIGDGLAALEAGLDYEEALALFASNQPNAAGVRPLPGGDEGNQRLVHYVRLRNAASTIS